MEERIRGEEDSGGDYFLLSKTSSLIATTCPLGKVTTGKSSGRSPGKAGHDVTWSRGLELRAGRVRAVLKNHETGMLEGALMSAGPAACAAGEIAAIETPIAPRDAGMKCRPGTGVSKSSAVAPPSDTNRRKD